MEALAALVVAFRGVGDRSRAAEDHGLAEFLREVDVSSSSVDPFQVERHVESFLEALLLGVSHEVQSEVEVPFALDVP